MTKEYKRFYYQQKLLLNSHVVAKKVRRQVLGPSVRAVVERGKTQSSRPPAEKDGYKVGGQTPYEIQKSSGTSLLWGNSIIRSGLRNSWVMNENKTQVKGDGICLVSRGGKGTTVTGVYPSHGSLRLITNRTPLPCEKRSAWGGSCDGMVQTSSPLKISMLWFIGPLHLLPFLTIWP